MMLGKIFNEKFMKRLIAIVLLAAVLSIVFGKSVDTKAIFDVNKAITYQAFASKVTVEDSVLFIGTYIVHKDALNDSIYEKASDSASDSGQDNIYYKSEISDGQWFEVGDIDNGIKGISEEGLPVSIGTINPLYVTYYVGSDGIMRDAKTMAAINPFDVPDPYDLSSLPELEPIWTQYTMSESKDPITQAQFLENKGSKDSGNLRSDVYYYQLLSTFFSLNLRDAQTDKCDEQLKMLNTNYINLKAAGEEDEAQLVYGLMEKVDATRRALIFERLSELDDNLLNTLYTLSTGSYYTPYGDFKDSSSEENRDQQADYTIKLEDSLKRNFTGINTASPFINNWLGVLGVTQSESGWWTVLNEQSSSKQEREEEANKEQDDYQVDLTEVETPFNPDSGLLDAIGSSMGNCSNSYTTYLGKALVDSDDILGHVIYDYSKQVIEGSSDSGMGGPVTYLKHATNIRDSIINDKQGELDLLLNSLISQASGKYQSSATAGVNSEYGSLSTPAAQKTSLEGQKTAEESDRSMLQFLIEAMRQRDEAPNALEFVNQRIVWTEDLLNDIPGDDYKTYSTSSVQAHIVWLKEEAQRIIDSDESLRSKLDELLAKKEELQKKRDACLDNNDLAGAKAYDAKIAAVDQDIAKEGGDQGNMTDKLVDKALSKLADDANADLSGVAGALADVGAGDALDALADKAKDSGASANAMAGINDAKDSMNDGKGNVDTDALLAQLESLFGKSLDDMDENELAVAGATCSRLTRSGIEAADPLTKTIVNKLINSNNRFTFKQFDDKTKEYIPMKTISDCTDYRYFYDDSKAMATMTKGQRIYIFRRGSDDMYKQSTENDPEQMNNEIEYNGVVYMADDDSQNYFKCDPEYCVNTEYGICLTATKQSQVAEYTETMTEFFNGE